MTGAGTGTRACDREAAAEEGAVAVAAGVLGVPVSEARAHRLPGGVKALLLEHCTDLNRDPYIQGAGLANLIKMLVNC